MKTKLLILICFCAGAKSVYPQFIMPTSGSQNVSTCGGMFYDSGGAVGNYSNNENGSFIFCSTLAGQYVVLTFTSIALFDNTDILRIYSGTGTGGPLLQTFQGPLNTTSFCAAVVSQDSSGGCLTAQFISGNSGVSSGWSAMLSCNPTPSVPPAGSTCANPVIIPSVPYVDSVQCTQCMLNDYQTQAGICNTSYAGEDRVYSYTTTGPECDSIIMANTSGNPALAIYMNCPGAGGICLTPTPMGGNNSMQFTFPTAGSYYIIIDETSAYACYDLTILPCATGIDEMSLSSNGNISVTQNALAEQITFRWKNNRPSSIIISDSRGRLMYSATTNESSVDISTETLAEGVYFVRVSDGKKNYTDRFVVVR